MSRFLSPVIVSPVSAGDYWMLETPLIYESDLLEDVVVVPAYFIYDGNSLPRPLWVISQPMLYPGSAALHDWGYRFNVYPREVVDQLYREALEVEGAGWLRRTLRYAGVRLGGWWAYNRGRDAE